MIIDDNFNNGNNFKIHRNNEPTIPNKLHSNKSLITPDNNLLTKSLSSFKTTDPANSQDMADKSVAMLHERYKNKLISSDNFNNKCTNIAKNRQ